jgi:uncharacterized Zn finger protein
MTILLFCPACEVETSHEVLSGSHDLVVRCSECGTVHRTKPEPEPRMIPIRAIVSAEGTSMTGSVEMFGDEHCSVGDKIVAEYGDEACAVEVTAIETGERRVQSAVATEISTLWTRCIDQVIVRVSVHDGRKTIPLYIQCEGEEDFEVGSVHSDGRIRFRVTRIKLRNGALMKKEGWKAYARKIKRVYGIRL